MKFEFAYVLTIVVSVILIVWISPVARKIGLVDKPNRRKYHHNHVPLVGGIVIALSVFTSLLLFDISLQSFRVLFFCLATIMIFGVIDDYQDTSALKKLFIQLLVAIVLVILDGRLVDNIGNIFGLGYDQGLNILAVPFTILAIVGVINAVNMIDGLDGLASITTIVSLVALLVVTAVRFSADLQSVQVLMVVTVLSLVVFTVFNFSRLVGESKQIFLGDAGSTFLGLLLAYLLIYFSSRDVNLVRVTTAPWFIGLPLLDLVVVIVLRFKNRQPLFVADRSHIHYQLSDYLGSKRKSLVVLVAVHLLFVMVGLMSIRSVWPDWILFWLMWGVCLFAVLLVAKLEKLNKTEIDNTG
jgi:UDP-GlcNAc:undecaprenyl-phosphate GlcNAc-1-phosphate transferase